MSVVVWTKSTTAMFSANEHIEIVTNQAVVRTRYCRGTWKLTVILSTRLNSMPTKKAKTTCVDLGHHAGSDWKDRQLNQDRQESNRSETGQIAVAVDVVGQAAAAERPPRFEQPARGPTISRTPLSPNVTLDVAGSVVE